MTTNEKIRDISELLSLGTYQGMSDEEIDKIIEFKVTMLLRKQLSQVNLEIYNIEMEEHLARIAQTNERVVQYMDEMRTRRAARRKGVVK